MFQPQRLLEWGLDALEVHNAGVLTPGCNRLARRLGKRIDIAVMGNSDAHSAGAVGAGQTLFPGHTPDDLREAILHKRTWAVGRAWPLAEYRKYTRSLIQRRGQVQHQPLSLAQPN
jgi:predicted metal-dependent phosphoesterase TrpH